MTPSWEDFVRLGPLPLIGVRLPSGEVEMSPRLLDDLHLDPASRPRSLEQWGELWHPSDHARALELNQAVQGRSSLILSLSRRLYCGDGVYRSFRLDAAIWCDEGGRPVYLMGTETLAEPGAAPRAAETEAEAGPPSQLRLSETAGEENTLLRHALQRRVLDALGRPVPREGQGPGIVIGVRGAAGSGKSALVNALMGERLLPEGVEAGAATVLCRAGNSRSVKVLYRDGRTEWAEGRTLTPRWMGTRLSERGNPGDGPGVLRVEWTSPGAVLPPDILLALSGEGVANPDALLYVIPIRARLQARELRELREAREKGQNFALILTQIDLEEEEREGGRLLRSRRERLERTIQDLREDLRPLAPEAPIIPVSSRWALRNFYDRASPGWRAGNFAPLLQAISRLAAHEAPQRGFPALPEDPPRGEGKVSGLVGSILTSVREQELRDRFLALPALRRGRRLLLLGPRRQEGLRLLSRLAHDANLEDREAGDWDWLFAGREPPFPCARLPELPDGLEALLAPSDAFLEEGLDWGALLRGWTPVVQVDLARLDLGLEVLAQAPYRKALAQAPHWVLSFVHGGLLRGRLPHLALEVPKRVEAFTERLGFVGRMSWFICENYDPRYTDFLALGKRAARDPTGEIAALTGLWEEWGLDYAPPFSREEMGMALLGIQDRSRERRDEE